MPPADLTKKENAMPGFWERTRTWLKVNQVFFETVSATSLAVIGIALVLSQGCTASYFSKIQADISDSQLKVAERQEKLYQKELELVDLQTRLALASASPRWTFEFEYQAGNLTIKNEGEAASKIEATSTPYLEFQVGEKVTRRLELRNLFYQAHGGATESGAINLYIAPELVLPAVEGFIQRIGNQSENANELPPADTIAIVKYFVDISYVDRAGNPRQERYHAVFPEDQEVVFRDAIPTFDSAIDIDEFSHDEKYDVAGLVAKVRKYAREISAQP